ncbi:glutathione S-transferase family protein [Desertibaculum subflavum]|uniref:glutathione S-transferase family protein n=1 Tax=Desertibaculum subflavum TaxID=2268458 RepID=UPI000E672C69
MIEIHHLNNSRSQRILWLLEELGVEYRIVPYQREPTRLAPAALKAIHPLGKSPVIRDDGQVVAESGAIVEYLVRKYDKAGKLAPPIDPSSAEWCAWNHWLHFAEGSAMLPLMLKLYVGRLGEAGAPLAPRIDSELKNHFDYMEGALGTQDYFVGNRFTAADIQLSFVLDAGAQRGGLAAYPRLTALHERLKARPAYQRALDKGGPYELGR